MTASVVLLLAALGLLGAVPWWPPALRGVPASGGPRDRLGGVGRARGHPDRRAPGRAASLPAVDPAVVLDLAAAALEAGASIPGALAALGDALDGARPPGRDSAGIPGGDGVALRRSASALMRGTSWEEAWSGAPPRLLALAVALQPAWVDGVAAGPLLRRAADRFRAGQARAAEEAAARLGVRLVLPLGLCFLPSFVLLGLVPVVLSAGAGLFG